METSDFLNWQIMLHVPCLLFSAMSFVTRNGNNGLNASSRGKWEVSSLTPKSDLPFHHVFSSVLPNMLGVLSHYRLS